MKWSKRCCIYSRGTTTTLHFRWAICCKCTAHNNSWTGTLAKPRIYFCQPRWNASSRMKQTCYRCSSSTPAKATSTTPTSSSSRTCRTLSLPGSSSKTRTLSLSTLSFSTILAFGIGTPNWSQKSENSSKDSTTLTTQDNFAYWLS